MSPWAHGSHLRPGPRESHVQCKLHCAQLAVGPANFWAVQDYSSFSDTSEVRVLSQKGSRRGEVKPYGSIPVTQAKLPQALPTLCSQYESTRPKVPSNFDLRKANGIFLGAPAHMSTCSKSLGLSIYMAKSMELSVQLDTRSV